MYDVQLLLSFFATYHDRLRELRRDERGASGIETAIITAVLAGIAITLTIVIVNRIRGQATCISGGTTTCGQVAPGAP